MSWYAHLGTITVSPGMNISKGTEVEARWVRRDTKRESISIFRYSTKTASRCKIGMGAVPTRPARTLIPSPFYKHCNLSKSNFDKKIKIPREELFGMTTAMKKNNKQSIYFIGIGGIGMSALARLYHARGWNVSGLELRTPSQLITLLKKEGIRVAIGAPKRKHRSEYRPRGL